MKQTVRLVLVVLAIFCTTLPAAAAGTIPEGMVMMQCFGWDSQADGQPGRWWSMLEKRAADLADLGVNLVWLPPPYRSVSRQGYLPGAWYDLGQAGNPTFYGNADQLRACLAALHRQKILALADIVINHRCASHQDEHGFWNIYHFADDPSQWEAWAVCGNDRKFNGKGSPDTGDDFGAAADIDHSNPRIQRDIVAWLSWLKKQGFDGWRYDYTKGYSGAYVKAYNEATKPLFSVGELWTSLGYESPNTPAYDQNHHRQQLCDWLDAAGERSTAFDFTTKGILQAALKKGEYWRLRDKDGKQSGLMGWWPERAVTFIDNHDTGSTQQHWPFPGEHVLEGYVYILTHPGTPCLFWEHVYHWNLREPLKKLIQIRRQAKITATSPLKIEAAEQGLYAARVGSRLAVKLGWKDWHPGEGWREMTKESRWSVWIRE